jgi:hypothetical protein
MFGPVCRRLGTQHPARKTHEWRKLSAKLESCFLHFKSSSVGSAVFFAESAINSLSIVFRK